MIVDTVLITDRSSLQLSLRYCKLLSCFFAAKTGFVLDKIGLYFWLWLLMYNIQVLITDRSSLPLPLLGHSAGDLPLLPQLGGEAADVADGLQDDVQLGHIVLDAHTRDQALQSGMRNRVLDQ